MELEGDSIRVKNELESLEVEKLEVIQMLQRKKITDEEYDALIAPLRDKIAVAKLAVNEITTDTNEMEVCLKYGQHFIRTASLVWFDAPPVLQMKIQKMIFPKGIKYAFEEISNRDLALPFALNRQFAKVRNTDVSPLGLEPRTNSLKGYCSNQLS